MNLFLAVVSYADNMMDWKNYFEIWSVAIDMRTFEDFLTSVNIVGKCSSMSLAIIAPI